MLRDKQWHCRECEYQHTGITQIAGGSGIQGLQRGTRTRSGIKIDSGNFHCMICDKVTRHDQWRGDFQLSVHSGSMPRSFINKTMRVFDSRDVIENTKRPVHELTIDHKLPMIRWNQEANRNLVDYANMDENDIKAHFQLLKKSNGSISHNMLKSRACEECYRTGKRGQPFGIFFFYKGGPEWMPSDKKDPAGCVGCGWYDFALWRENLNKLVRRS